ADATGTNQPDVTDIFCGKPQRSPASEPTKARTTAESRRNPGFSFLPTVKQRQGMAGKPHDDSRRFIERVEFVGLAQKRETRPGGQPDGSSYMGAWGGWALAPNTASTGRDLPLPHILSREGSPNVQTACDFFLTFWQVFFWQVFFIARRADWLRERPPCRKPWRHPARSRPWAREPPYGPRLFQRQGG